MGPATRVVVVALFALLAGCTALLELEQPVLLPDGGIDSAPDANTPDARACPAPPAGCNAFRCAGSASCYYACSGSASWSTAQSYCTQVGCLATIESQAEQECIAAATAPTSSSPVWIGAYQVTADEPAQGWTWACGTSSFTDWGGFEPNDYAGDQDCAELANGGHWADATCGYSRRFVCELP